MLLVNLNEEIGVVTVEPKDRLTQADFDAVAGVIDPYLTEHGVLNGLVIVTEDFPGWDSFGALVKHLKFVRQHHEKLSRVALVTDSAIGDLAEKLASHFVSAQVRHFSYLQLADAQAWVKEYSTD